MNIRETGYGPGIPAFRNDKALRTLPGGFVLDTSKWPDGAEIPAGTAIAVDESERTAIPVKTAELAKAASAADLQLALEKGHCIAPGDKLNGKSVASVDTSGPVEDIAELAAPFGKAMPKGAKIGTGDGNALLLRAVRVARGDARAVDAVIGGTVYERRIGHISEQTRKNLPNVAFTQSK